MWPTIQILELEIFGDGGDLVASQNSDTNPSPERIEALGCNL